MIMNKFQANARLIIRGYASSCPHSPLPPRSFAFFQVNYLLSTVHFGVIEAEMLQNIDLGAVSSVEELESQ